MPMTTKETIEGYFGRLAAKDGWEAFLSEDVAFTSFTSPNKSVNGRAAYLEATRRFYASIAAVEVRSVIVEGTRACALTRYRLQRPGGPAFDSDVAEVFGVRDGRISSLDIYFDSAPFPK
jgi:ketosteroid isomerase-like protein